uniref:Uncharacterized protein n=1 Tax=Anguilla anguilla TaxID=7936 RepID=A0A0E9XLQ5_ANGAN
MNLDQATVHKNIKMLVSHPLYLFIMSS